MSYAKLDMPKMPLAKEDRHQPWNASSTLSHKTVPAFWHDDTVYLYGVDLFNAGLYWEAHEVWERKWLFFKRHHENVATWMKGLIQVSAAFLKLTEGRFDGFHSNILKAIRHLSEHLDHEHQMGIHTEEWIQQLKMLRVQKDLAMVSKDLPKIVLEY